MYPFSHLPRRLSQEIFASLCRSLPPPYDDTQEALDSRDTIAMAAIAALDPHDAAEAEFAVQVILAEAQARHSLEQANKFADDLKVSMQCRAQARSMMQQTQAGLRGLQRLQATRERPEMALRRHEAEAAARAAGVLAAVAARMAEQSDGVADAVQPGSPVHAMRSDGAADGARLDAPTYAAPPDTPMPHVDADPPMQAGNAGDGTDGDQVEGDGADRDGADTPADINRKLAGSVRAPLRPRSAGPRHSDQNQSGRFDFRYNETFMTPTNVGRQAALVR